MRSRGLKKGIFKRAHYKFDKNIAHIWTIFFPVSKHNAKALRMCPNKRPPLGCGKKVVQNKALPFFGQFEAKGLCSKRRPTRRAQKKFRSWTGVALQQDSWGWRCPAQQLAVGFLSAGRLEPPSVLKPQSTAPAPWPRCTHCTPLFSPVANRATHGLSRSIILIRHNIHAN